MVRVAVLVLGDLGRSPRMSAHCLSLARLGHNVDLIGYAESDVMQELQQSDRVSIHALRAPMQSANRWPFLTRAIYKITLQICTLMYALLVRVRRPSWILVQNPPSIPTLHVVWLCSWLLWCRVLIDWHNFGFTILQLGLGDGVMARAIVGVARLYEWAFGRLAAEHVCVTDAMREELATHWGIAHARVLHDAAQRHFRRLTDVAEVHELFVGLHDELMEKVGAAHRVARDAVGKGPRRGEQCTFLTRRASASGVVRWRRQRPFVVVSSTSFGRDEDFGVLLAALQLWQARMDAGECERRGVLVMITGKGEMRAHFEDEAARMGLRDISVVFVWLPIELYPRVLGAADVGVSLHLSSSGLDLPMKVVDMFACELPVCAVGFRCLGELVRHGENGEVFDTSEQLEASLSALAAEPKRLEAYRSHLREHRTDWDAAWEEALGNLFRRD